MKKKKSSNAGCILGIAIFLLITISSSVYYRNYKKPLPLSDTISWADAAEKCKAQYKAQRPAGMVKVSNCRKRTEDDDFFYFFWKRPLSIFIKNSDGGQDAYPGTCQVARKSGKIVHLTLNKKVLVNTVEK